MASTFLSERNSAKLLQMKIKGYSHLLSLIALFALTVGAYLWFVYSSHYGAFVGWAQSNPLIFYPTLFLTKAAGIVWPPLPGGVLTLGAVYIVGWWQAYLIDISGSIFGSVIAFGIAKKWGRGFVSKILDEKTIEKIDHIRVKPNRQFESIFLFRVFGGTVVEIVVYAAGLLKVSFKKFLIASVLSHMVTGIPMFFFADSIIQRENIYFNVILLVIAVVLFIKMRKRYFEQYQEDIRT